MRTKISISLLFALFLFCSCQAQIKTEKRKAPRAKATAIAYTIATRYFVKNTVNPQSLKSPKIETEEQFNEYFGAATVMGKDGKPTPINFAKQFVIAVLTGDTDLATEIKPLSLNRENKQIVLNYQVKVGAKQSFTMSPLLILIVDKKETGEVILKQTAH